MANGDGLFTRPRSLGPFSLNGSATKPNLPRGAAEAFRGIRPPNICRLPKNPGEGDRSMPMYRYDPFRKACEIFAYKGQKGNPNRFATLVMSGDLQRPSCALPAGEVSACVSGPRPPRCPGPHPTFPSAGQPPRPPPMALLIAPPDLCQLPMKVGPCEALLPRFHYDAARQMCTRFYYGGCQGNLNNFGTREGCLLTCKGP
ncbi:BPTI/Kunitz domain-containing protein-like, partial [Python bivittatus]|uniref:BPTI/Kunitz domain-containing protein-like n=1 Tax=Python bivittatus TaxID=176946 RepID=A0A9F5J5C5_PYTBI